MRKFLVFLFSAFCSIAFAQNEVHSHNDYEQNVPFWKAFSAGCTSIEADVILYNNDLMVSHDVKGINAQNNFENLYLKPLRIIATSNNYTSFNLQILIDLKTEAVATLAVLQSQIEKYPELINGNSPTKKISFVISGNRPKPEQYENYPSYVNFDYQTLDTWPNDMSKVALVSVPFYKYSRWNGKGRLTEADENKIKEAVSLAHSKNKKIRFWATPDSKTAWFSLSQLGVDYINTDQPFECVSYLKTLEDGLVKSFSPTKAETKTWQKSTKKPAVILMVGDGNGLAQWAAGMYSSQTPLNITKIKTIGLVKTQPKDDFTTDSAAGGTAMASGQKTNNRYIGVDENKKVIPSIFDLLKKKNISTGIITTDQMTGATPSAFYGHVADRDSSQKLAEQLVNSKIDIFIGAGKSKFKNFEWKSRLILDEIPVQLPQTKSEIGIFVNDNSLPYVNQGRENYLEKTTNTALQYLSKKENGFMLLIENGHIDGAGHDNKAKELAAEVIEFDKTIGQVMRYVDSNPGTLLVITADHETGGVVLPHGYKDGIEIQFHSNDHSGIPVPLFAYGKGSENFGGVYENTAIFDKILEYFGRK